MKEKIFTKRPSLTDLHQTMALLKWAEQRGKRGKGKQKRESGAETEASQRENKRAHKGCRHIVFFLRVIGCVLSRPLAHSVHTGAIFHSSRSQPALAPCAGESMEILMELHVG